MAFLVPDDLWAVVEPLLPPARAKPKGGRPRAPDRVALAGILFVLRTAACCMDPEFRRTRPNPIRDQAMRTETGRPSSSMRLSA